MGEQLDFAARQYDALHLLAFNEHATWRGPRRLTQAEIRTTFEQGWKVEAISTSRFEVVDGCGDAEAWLASIRRLSPAGLTGEIR